MICPHSWYRLEDGKNIVCVWCKLLKRDEGETLAGDEDER
jgi:hypothetical protein